jgi:hypothetical protein
MSIIKVKSLTTGKEYEYDQDKHAGSGAMKEVYFAPDRSYVVQIFKEKQDANSMERLKTSSASIAKTFSIKRAANIGRRSIAGQPTS